MRKRTGFTQAGRKTLREAGAEFGSQQTPPRRAGRQAQGPRRAGKSGRRRSAPRPSDRRASRPHPRLAPQPAGHGRKHLRQPHAPMHRLQARDGHLGGRMPEHDAHGARQSPPRKDRFAHVRRSRSRRLRAPGELHRAFPGMRGNHAPRLAARIPPPRPRGGTPRGFGAQRGGKASPT